jgi:DNA-binding MarR family transcriptional regulator
VTQREAVVLLHLARRGENTINDVHRAFLHKRSTLTSVVDRLERKGLVRRRIGEADRRNFALVLTAEGTRTANRVLQAVSDLHASLDTAPAQLQATTALLDQTAAELLKK